MTETVQKGQRVCHYAVKKMAIEMAGSYYEDMAGKSDLFYKTFPNQKEFMRVHWGQPAWVYADDKLFCVIPDFITEVRKVLPKLLESPTLSDHSKREIEEIILLEKQIPQKQRGNNTVH
jgi:hypothetical protein